MSASSRNSSRDSRSRRSGRTGQSTARETQGRPPVRESVSEPTPRSARKSAPDQAGQAPINAVQPGDTPSAATVTEIPDFLLHPASKAVAEEDEAEVEARQQALDSLDSPVPELTAEEEANDGHPERPGEGPSAHDVVERIAREEETRRRSSRHREKPQATAPVAPDTREARPAVTNASAKVPSVADDLDEPEGVSAPANVPDRVIESDIAALEDLERHLYAHRYAEVGMGVYGLTIDPPHAMDDRAEAMAILQEEDRERLCSPRMGATLRRLSASAKRLDPTTLAQVRVLTRDRDRIANVDPADQAALSKLTNEADYVWRRAKRDNDWDSFEAYLDRIVELMRKVAQEKDPGRDPYDVWLDENEQGTSREFYDGFFDVVKDTVVPLLMDVRTKRQPSRACIEGRFDENRQWLLARDIAVLEGIDLDSYWLTATEHPFSDALSINYAVTAAHVHADDIASNVFTMLHEGGHNLYELGVRPAYNHTSLRGGTSAGMHEAQSRFFENYVGRSEAFAGPLLQTMQTYFRGQLGRVTPHQFYLAVNRADPQPLRMDADELTYPLHIVVRYEIEQKLFSGEATAHDVPGLWRDLYKSYLGVRVPDATRGPLQDSHWADGLFGYFPTYALGGAYGAQLRDQMISEGMDWDGLLSRADLAPIREWLRVHVWQWGRAKDPAEIIQEACHKPFDPTHYTNYLRKKFSDIYGLD